SVTSQVAEVPTLVFDEVDSGIGGRVAEIVGQMLKQLGRKHQVMCITHLPQVAASADHQWQVARSETKTKITSRVIALDHEQRVVLNPEITLGCDLDLPFLDFGVVELLNVTTFDADDMVVMTALLELEHRFAGFEVVTDQQARLFELSEHAIDRREAGVGSL